jgi:hypothetical protein
MAIPISCENCGEIINFLNPPQRIINHGRLWFCCKACRDAWLESDSGLPVTEKETETDD